MSSTFQMQQWWLWWRGFAAAPICSKVVILQQWWFAAFIRSGAAFVRGGDTLCIWCVVHGGVMMVVQIWMCVRVSRMLWICVSVGCKFCVGCRWWLTVFLLQKLLQCSGALRRRRRNCGGRKVCF